MEFLIATSVVALAEVGDKTQLLSLLLAARYRKPWPIVLGILAATVANHAAAAWLGQLVQSYLTPEILRWVLGVSFLAVAAWTLIPDRMEEEDHAAYRYGPFAATLILFFLAEIGDKTQVATIMLAARYPSLVMVVTATTLGMLIANVPVVWLGGKAAERLPLRVIRGIAAGLFAILGVWALVGS
ncbi:TMEM165/GDT1 family protein [Candidatus Binatia bacterium]|nr:TMEM165/GDT1 family protein [Candidatus Binatia bacterium]